MSIDSNLEKQIFAEAIDLPAPERDLFLRGACRGDESLRQRVLDLLRSHDNASHILRTHPPSLPSDPEAPTQLSHAPILEGPGSWISHYKLLQQIGEGGCGTVFMAEQEHPIRRRVALKVIKLGMDTKSVIARFEAERQALSLMDHPNIARVLDAGATHSGRPFFAMELVKGIPITRYCNENRLDTHQRLDLFIKVCHAVQHAHQKGIVHRDLKPSNILVTLHDGSPIPKVIDFGIAKATEGRLTDRTLFTAFEQFIGTPAYMSPEQAQIGGLDIDTRCDIYSLGVLLYELLTGKTPFDARFLADAGLDAIRKTIQEIEPPRPSTRLSTLDGKDLDAAAQAQGIDPTKLLHRIRGDLDWIVMKCLEKDRTRRYETANGLAADLQRHLQNEPVLARPPSAAYKFQKAIRRNKGVFAATGAIALALLVGIITTTWQLRVANLARRDAEAARVTAELSEKRARAAETSQANLRQQADAQAQLARKTAYSSEIRLALQSLQRSNLGEAQRLLNNQTPSPNQNDLRGWEWRYLWNQSRPDENELIYPGPAPWSPNTLSFSPNNLWLARGDDGGISVMDLTSRSLIWFQAAASHPAFFNRSPKLSFVDENRSATNGAFYLKQIDLPTKSLTTLASFTNKISRMRMYGRSRNSKVWWHTLTPDDRTLIVVSDSPSLNSQGALDRQVSAWSVSEGQQLWSVRCDEPESDLGRLHAMSPDGTSLALALTRGRVQILDVATGRERSTRKFSDELITAVAFSPDSRLLLTGSGYSDSRIRVWDAILGTTVSTIEGHKAWVSGLWFTPDAKHLISSSADQTIRTWNWPTSTPDRVLQGHRDEVYEIQPSPDGSKLLSRCKDGSILLWNLARPSQTRGYRPLPVRWVGNRLSVAFHPDGDTLVGVETNGAIVALSLRGGNEKWRIPKESTNNIHSAVSPDGQFAYSRVSEATHRIWEVSSGRELPSFIPTQGWHKASLTRNGKLLVMRFSELEPKRYDFRYQVWNLLTQALEGEYKTDFEGFAIGMPLTLSATNLFCHWRPNGLELRSLTHPSLSQPVATLGLGLEELLLRELDVSPDGQSAASVYDEGVVAFWNVGRHQLLHQFRGFMLGAFTISFSPDGRRVAAGSSFKEAVKLWDSETYQELLTLEGEGSLIPAVVFSPDGRHLLALNNDGLPHLWSAPSFEEIKAIQSKDDEQYRSQLAAYIQFEERRLSQATAALGRSHPHVQYATRTLQFRLASNARPRDAIALEPQPTTTTEEDTLDYTRIAALQIWFGSPEDYEITRRKMLQQFKGASSARTAERTAKAACLAPIAIPTQTQEILTLAESALRLETDNSARRWCLLALGMAEFRSHRLPQALQHLLEAENASDPGERVLRIIAAFYRVMALHHLGRHAEARDLFTRTTALATPMPAQPHLLLQGHKPIFIDYLVGWITQLEAERLITTPKP